jgi:hypothetical protein
LSDGAPKLFEKTMDVTENPNGSDLVAAKREQRGSRVLDLAARRSNAEELCTVRSRVREASERFVAFADDVFDLVVEIGECAMNEVHILRKLGVTSLVLTQGSAEFDIIREKLRYLQFVEPIPQVAVEALDESYVPFAHPVPARRPTHNQHGTTVRLRIATKATAGNCNRWLGGSSSCEFR